MDQKLRQDLHRFFHVYTDNVGDILRESLPPQIGIPLETKLNEEFDLLARSIMNRVEEEYRF